MKNLNRIKYVLDNTANEQVDQSHYASTELNDCYWLASLCVRFKIIVFYYIDNIVNN